MRLRGSRFGRSSIHWLPLLTVPFLPGLLMVTAQAQQPGVSHRNGYVLTEPRSAAGDFAALTSHYSHSHDTLAVATSLQSALLVAGQAPDRTPELIELVSQFMTQFEAALAFNDAGEFDQALERYQAALELAQSGLALAQETELSTFELAFLQAMAITYREIATIYRVLGEAAKLEPAGEIGESSLTATEAFQQELAAEQQALPYIQSYADLAQQVEDADAQTRAQQLTSLVYGGLGGAYTDLGQLPAAIEAYQQALTAARALGNAKTEAQLLILIANRLTDLSQYSQALDHLQEALAVAKVLPERSTEGTALQRIGYVLRELGQPEQAIAYYQQALVIATALEDDQKAVDALIGLGTTSQGQGQDKQALEYYQQAILINQELETLLAEPLDAETLAQVCSIPQLDALDPDRLYTYSYTLCQRNIRYSQSLILNNTAVIYVNQDRYAEALALYQQSLALDQALAAPGMEAITRGNLGALWSAQGNYDAALGEYQQALSIFEALGSRAEQAWILGHVGELFSRQGQPELAIVFYKQAVNLTETIRGDIRDLSQELRQSYTDRVADTYRDLADLLLQQNRVLEAQRVLDLLRVQELDDYLQDVRGNDQTTSGVDYWEPEQYILELYNQTIQEGIELAQLEAKASLTSEEGRRRDELLARQDELRHAFNQFRNRDDVQAAITQLRTTTNSQTIEISQFNRLQNSLADLDTGAVLLYPLILEDRLELVLITPYGAPIRRSVPVTATELNRAIVALGQALKDPTIDAQAPAQQLYQWLIADLEADLTAANAKTIIYAPDGALRYIPLAALHDGQQWLAQRFAITHITAASLIDFNVRPTYQADDLQLLAAACVQCSFEINGFRFNDLPYAGVEVETLAAQIPDTELRLNRSFNASDLRSLMRNFPIVHLATHAKFVPGQAYESFIVLGDGSSVSLRDIQSWNLPNTDLVVLSACETGLGEAQLGSGVEILGFGYLMQDAGAKAAIASLWQVSDGGTRVLMNAFYAALQAGYTKAEALQLAQQALIQGELEIKGTDERAEFNLVTARTGLPDAVNRHLNHPYYWAPFILIGNGL